MSVNRNLYDVSWQILLRNHLGGLNSHKMTMLRSFGTFASVWGLSKSMLAARCVQKYWSGKCWWRV